MNQRTLYRAAYLLALCIGGAIASAGVRDLRWHPSIPDPPILRATASGIPTTPPIGEGSAVQQASLRTVIRNSDAGPQRYLYTYHPDGLMETERIQCHKSGTWNDSLRTTRTYTAAGRLRSEYAEQYLQGAFRSLRRWSIEYNEVGDVISSLSEAGGWLLAPVSRTLYCMKVPRR